MKATQRTRELLEGFLRAAIAGVAGGCVALGFNDALKYVQGLLIGVRPDHDTLKTVSDLPWWQRLVLPGAGMLVAAIALRYLAGAAKGGTFADVMESVSARRGPVSLRSAVIRGVAAFAIVVTGNSVGREGLIIVVSAAAASALANVLRTPVRDRGLLLGCGVAAGFAAAYNAPIAGAIFALEIVVGNFAMELFAPVVVASVMATLVTRYIGHHEEPIYRVPIVGEAGERFVLQSPFIEIGFYLVLGVLGGFVAVGFQTMLRRAAQFVRSIPASRVVTMAAGGLAVGAIAIVFPYVWGNGYDAVSWFLSNTGARMQNEIWPDLALLMLAMMFVKAVATAVTVGSGGAGGIFTPSLFVGAALGGAFGAALHHLFPGVTGDFGGYALVGMGCLVAGTTRAPIMAIMVMFEMTLDYRIVLPLMLACITASLVARTIHANSIYGEELAERGTKTPQGLEETVLVTTRVADVMRENPTWVAQKTTYDEIARLVSGARATAVNVCGDGMRLLGVIRVHDVITLLSLGDLGPGIVAADLMSPVDPVTRDEPLSTVFEAFDLNDVDEMPVVDSAATRRLVGTVTRRDVMAALHNEVLKRQNLRAKFVRRDDDAAQTDYVELPKGVELARVPAHPSHFGRTLGESQIRTVHKLTVLSVVRHDEEDREIRVLPDAGMRIAKGDDLIVIGALEDIAKWRAEVGDR
jgi:CIC family chloride channel protein